MLATLTVAGSDPTGGAGIQADLQTFCSLGAHGAAVPTALTVQDTGGVHDSFAVPAAYVAAQLRCLTQDMTFAAMKTGMLGTAAVVQEVAALIGGSGAMPLVVDPVLRASGGPALLDEEGLRALVESLLPLAALATPNIAEAEVLSGQAVCDAADMARAAERIAALGPAAVVVTGGHLAGEPVDVLYADGQVWEVPGVRVDTGGPVHGTGCAFSASAAVFLGQGHSVADAVRKAKAYVAGGLRAARRVGRGAAVVNYGAAATAALG